MGRKNTDKVVFHQIQVLDAGAKGVSVAKAPDGKVIFIPNVVPGDVVDVQTFKKRKAYYEGKAVKFHELSEHRVDPICEHFGVCGGCKWQNMKYSQQLYYKQNEVKNHLQRIGKVELPEFETILGSEKQFFYRNKMEFSFSNSRWLTEKEIGSTEDLGNRNALGFHIPKMWDKILDIEKCHLQEDPSNAIRNEIRAFANEHNLAFFNPREHSGLLRTLMIRTASTGEIMVLIQFFEDDKANRELVLDHLYEKFPQITSLQYVVNAKQNDTIYDQDIKLYKGRNYILEEMEGLKFSINAKSFYQTNSDQAYELYKITRDYAGLTGEETVYDLYTGTGTIAQFVSKKAKKVIGVESVPEAILDAKANAERNNITNCEFFVGDMKVVFNEAFIAQHGKPDVIITDPPRDGMHAAVIDQILKIAPKKVVYVSCNSATQARDLALMDEKYKVTRVRPVDMFPQTHHVENVVLLELR
ncbi:23S rRNA (uracil(1939)-C(5))-methyltransferase RlmD [Flavobacterium johnsoniae]|jgi:23S rRNA (uracil1939-C5)-methyltransferase|uniref:23S rRNA m(5)U-1939 methyltransferase n=2 Tax=Flavobacterium johnsoniae TaxID=986 RepID=A0A1M5P5U8_FLAJO|nr:23S rRNA (uracil(1939)-C(5))-methyltransferase RlmD [Flavobacterium johnsoniae]ABQ05527.1 RNA methyltransferase, TrmA family [Flavobacterium johnsoniae UW101]OXE96744.1 23S rRNA (uracil-5-)-methyltransferase RumA [Flavobacterium johnsoniae UW101]WQG82671.1 23S rRNA (uracil(1939)-C(5))-methyltransferase RlmD [Flavobacterium johnsoniae UW101]SHG97201.1 23S rRNA m(5)U-1939 methyltransferase [Flavobacterium johnsoniae]SHL54689.1 23S rRNA m(5)U-1939 methyltransferase [Flavobacterium johnsoniae]